MARFTDEELVAYADGELPPDRAKLVAQACAADPEVAARVRLFNESRAALRDAFAKQIGEQVPERLLKVFDDQSKVVPLPDRGSAFRSTPARRRPSWIPMALAASVALAIGANVVMRWQPQNAAPENVAKFDDSLLQQPLERLASGEPQTIRGGGAIMPTASFVTDKGDYCREYEATIAGQKQRGLACRDEQRRWSTVVASIGNAATKPKPDDGFAPASGEGSEVDIAIGSSKRLTPAEEQAAIEHGWGEKK